MSHKSLGVTLDKDLDLEVEIGQEALRLLHLLELKKHAKKKTD